MSHQEIIDRLNDHRPPCLIALDGRVMEVDLDAKTTAMSFNIPTDFCHSVNVVQGGFVAAMLDAAMSHAIFASTPGCIALPTLELKVSYLAPSLAGSFTAVGEVIKAGRSIAFLEAKLYNSDGQLTATASSTAKPIVAKPE